MDHPVFYFLGQFYNSMTWCYPVILLLFFIWVFSKSRSKEELVNFLASINLGMGIAGLLALIVYVLSFYEAYFEMSRTENFEYRIEGVKLSADAYFLTMGFVLLIQLLFLFSMFRMSWVVSLLALLLLEWGWVLLFIRRIFGDDTTRKSNDGYMLTEKIIYIVIFVSATLLFYWLLAYSRRLPYVSAWLKFQRRHPDV